MTIDNIKIINSILEFNSSVWLCNDGIVGPRYYLIEKYYSTTDDEYIWEITKVRYKPKCPEIPFKEFLGLAIVPEGAQLILLDSLIPEIPEFKPVPRG